MIVTTNITGKPGRAPCRPAGTLLWASIDVEWTKNYRIKNGNRPFCYSVVYAALPDTSSPVDLAELPFSYTSVYLEDPEETDALLATANDAVHTAHGCCSTSCPTASTRPCSTQWRPSAGPGHPPTTSCSSPTTMTANPATASAPRSPACKTPPPRPCGASTSSSTSPWSTSPSSTRPPKRVEWIAQRVAAVGLVVPG